VLVVTRWRGDEAWDVAGYVGCRSYDGDGRRTETSALQMFFKDGHKVPLTMPAIQLAARLFTETYALAQNEENGTAAAGGRTPWPRDCEWTIRRTNMEVRRVLEAVLVFWGLRPSRTGTPDQPAPTATLFEHRSHHHHQINQPYPPSMQGGGGNKAQQDSAPYLSNFPLELRSVTDDLITVGCNQADAIASLMADLAGWSSTSLTVPSWHADPSRLAMGNLLPADFVQSGGRVLVTGLSMNFRGTQQKTPVERRDVLGATVADVLEMVQPIARDPEEQSALDRAHMLRREQRRAPKSQQVAPQQLHHQAPRPPPSYGAAVPPQQGVAMPMQQLQGGMFQPVHQQQQGVPMIMVPQQQQQQQQQQPQQLQLPSTPAPPGFTYVFMQNGSGGYIPVLMPMQQQQQQQQHQQQHVQLMQQPLQHMQQQQAQAPSAIFASGAAAPSKAQPQPLDEPSSQYPSVFGTAVGSRVTQEKQQPHWMGQSSSNEQQPTTSGLFLSTGF
jgi:hypothetical protein